MSKREQRKKKRRRTVEQERIEKERNLRALRFMYERPPGVLANEGAGDASGKGNGDGDGATEGDAVKQRGGATDIYGRKVATSDVHAELTHAPKEAGLAKGVVMRHNAVGAVFHASGESWSAKDKAWYQQRELPTERLREQERKERRQQHIGSTVKDMIQAREALSSRDPTARFQLKEQHSDFRIDSHQYVGGGNADGNPTTEQDLYAQLLELGASET